MVFFSVDHCEVVYCDVGYEEEGYADVGCDAVDYPDLVEAEGCYYGGYDSGVKQCFDHYLEKFQVAVFCQCGFVFLEFFCFFLVAEVFVEQDVCSAQRGEAEESVFHVNCLTSSLKSASGMVQVIKY